MINELRLKKSLPWLGVTVHYVIEYCVGNTRHSYLVQKQTLHTLNVFVPYEIK